MVKKIKTQGKSPKGQKPPLPPKPQQEFLTLKEKLVLLVLVVNTIFLTWLIFKIFF